MSVRIKTDRDRSVIRAALAAVVKAAAAIDFTGFGSCVGTDLDLDQKWIQQHGYAPFYWVITESATGIGQDPAMTVDYYREQTPSSVVACYRWDGATLHKLPNALGVACAGDDRSELPSWGGWGDTSRVQL